MKNIHPDVMVWKGSISQTKIPDFENVTRSQDMTNASLKYLRQFEVAILNFSFVKFSNHSCYHTLIQEGNSRYLNRPISHVQWLSVIRKCAKLTGIYQTRREISHLGCLKQTKCRDIYLCKTFILRGCSRINKKPCVSKLKNEL